MGLKLSTTNSNSQPRLRTYSASSPGTSGAAGPSSGINSDVQVVARNGAQSSRARARSLVNFQTAGNSSALGLRGAAGGTQISSSPDSESSSPEDMAVLFGGSRPFTHSLPVHLFALGGIKCPVCSKQIASDDIECHLVMCLTKPRINYNEDVLAEDKGECVICFEELIQGDTIARLPCLCIYHKGCIDKWFQVNRSCPEHPSDQVRHLSHQVLVDTPELGFMSPVSPGLNTSAGEYECPIYRFTNLNVQTVVQHGDNGYFSNTISIMCQLSCQGYLPGNYFAVIVSALE